MLGWPMMVPAMTPAMIAPARMEPPARGTELPDSFIPPQWHRRRVFASALVGESAVDEAGAAFRKGAAAKNAAGDHKNKRGRSVQDHVHVQDRAALAAATDLIARFGEHARLEAAARASQSRSLGNVIHFCHWRQIERAIEMLSGEEVTGTVH